MTVSGTTDELITDCKSQLSIEFKVSRDNGLSFENLPDYWTQETNFLTKKESDEPSEVGVYLFRYRVITQVD